MNKMVIKLHISPVGCFCTTLTWRICKNKSLGKLTIM